MAYQPPKQSLAAQILDVDGNVIFSVEVTSAGKRILIELP